MANLSKVGDAIENLLSHIKATTHCRDEEDNVIITYLCEDGSMWQKAVGKENFYHCIASSRIHK